MSPLAYVNQISALFRNLWPELDIAYDCFIRTTEPAHVKVVREVLQKIYDAGDIYFSEYEGAYCFGCERFYTDRELEDGRCPDHQTVPQVIRESNYFFRMSNYQGWLVEYIATHPDFIRPERYRNEVLARGYSRDAIEHLRSFLGREPSAAAYLENLGVQSADMNKRIGDLFFDAGMYVRAVQEYRKVLAQVRCGLLPSAFF